MFWYLLSFPFWVFGLAALWLIVHDFKRHGFGAFTQTPLFETLFTWAGLCLIYVAGWLCGLV